ncbi:hypothetical protein AXF42_Ash012943 [Apostasia shenzhenica]|uniref:Uncharacterized protein n=1 Tax=Apostasia shenzhenica TaxID=1088818 RepID=A0A2I0ARQ0_9ASPA|nr:hypothetical protein AXF42_Ash012943 [Apostasia shenzhenica]
MDGALLEARDRVLSLPSSLHFAESPPSFSSVICFYFQPEISAFLVLFFLRGSKL